MKPFDEIELSSNYKNMQNYSQTYAATITTTAGLLAVMLGKYGFGEADLEMIIGTCVAFFGIVWQLWHRYSKGGVSPVGVRRRD
jgi:hypothetical protein